MVAPGAEMSAAPNEPSRFRSKKTVPWAVWDATWKSRVIIQSGIPSPLASAGARLALSTGTGGGTDGEESAAFRGGRVQRPTAPGDGAVPHGPVARALPR